jgi:hypothetical protein
MATHGGPSLEVLFDELSFPTSLAIGEDGLSMSHSLACRSRVRLRAAASGIWSLTRGAHFLSKICALPSTALRFTDTS